MGVIFLAVSVILLTIDNYRQSERIEKVEFALSEVIDRYNRMIDKHNRIARIIEESVNKGE